MVNKKGNRQIERTKKAIRDAYLELLKESTTQKIKISEICQRANISRPTFYNHYQTKEEVLLTYLDEILDEMFIEYRELEVKSVDEAFTNFELASTRFFSLWQSKTDLYRLLKNVKAENLLIHKLKDHHLKTYHIIAKHDFPLHDPEILDHFISYISYTFFSVLDQWMITGTKHSPEEMGGILATIFDPQVIRYLSEKYS